MRDIEDGYNVVGKEGEAFKEVCDLVSEFAGRNDDDCSIAGFVFAED